MLDEPSGSYEQEADRISRHLGGGNQNSEATESAAPASRLAYPLIQRAALPGSSTGTTSAASAEAAQAAAEKPAQQQAPNRALLVDDDAEHIGPGQMRKTEFLDQLQAAVCAAADQELARVGRTAQGCPYIERWIAYYRMRSSQHIEKALFRYAPEAARANSAGDYIPMVAERIRRAVTVWATTGQITGVPEELAGQLGGGGLLGAAGGFLSGIAGAVTGAVGAVGRAIGGLFTKSKEGGSNQAAADPETVRSQLNAGQSLEGATRSRMERAFGHDFSNVKVHANSRAAELSTGLNARAFTVGSDIAFGAGEYQPGTLIGDALLAHELAHVVQQAKAAPDDSFQQRIANGDDSLEEDADRSAVQAVVSTRGGFGRQFGKISQSTMPHLRSGLRLQRCHTGQSAAQPRSTTPVSQPTTPMTEATGGDASCDPDQGRIVMNVDSFVVAPCLRPCAEAHESAHARFMGDQCARLGAVSQRAQQALDRARASRSASDLQAAEAAAQDLETAVANYQRWFQSTCVENESQAYQATIDACSTPTVQQQCRDSGKEELYRRNMDLWRRYLTNPPCDSRSG